MVSSRNFLDPTMSSCESYPKSGTDYSYSYNCGYWSYSICIFMLCFILYFIITILVELLMFQKLCSWILEFFVIDIILLFCSLSVWVVLLFYSVNTFIYYLILGKNKFLQMLSYVEGKLANNYTKYILEYYHSLKQQLWFASFSYPDGPVEDWQVAAANYMKDIRQGED